MKSMITEIKRTTNQVANGIGMVGLLCLALLLGTLSFVGADDLLE